MVAYRKAMEPRFPILPVLLGGVSAEDLSADLFSPLCLEAIQGLKPGDPLRQAAVDADAAGEVARAVLARLAAWQQQFGGRPPATPMDALEAALKLRIRHAADPDGLKRLCEQLTGRKVR